MANRWLWCVALCGLFAVSVWGDDEEEKGQAPEFLAAVKNLNRVDRLVIPTGDAARTDEGYVRDVALPFYERCWVEPFAGVVYTNEAHAAIALKLRKAVALRYAANTDGHMTVSLRNQAMGLKKAGAVEPAVLLACSLERAPKKEERLKCLAAAEKAIVAAPETNLVALLTVRGERFKLDEKPESLAAYMEAVKAAFAEKGLLNDVDPRIAFRLLNRYEFDLKGLNAIKMKDEWIRKVLLGARYFSDAFESRGGAAASEVTEEGWKGFGDYNKMSYALLEEAHKLHSLFPDAGVELTQVAKHTGGQSPLFWLNKTLAASLDVPEAIRSYAHFHTSRWCGSPRVLVELAKQLMRSRRYDSLLPVSAFDVLFHTILRYEFSCPEEAEAYLFDDRELVDLLYETVDGYLAEPPHVNTYSRDRYLRAGVVIALFDHNWPKARAYYKQLGDKRVHWQDWEILQRLPGTTYRHVYMPAVQALEKGRCLDDVGKADAMDAEGMSREAIALFQQIRERKDASEEEKKYCDTRAYRIRVREGLKGHEWFSLMPSPSRAESMGFWDVATVKNGVVRSVKNKRSTLCGTIGLPYDDVQFAGTVHFFPEEKQEKWEAHWSLSHVIDYACYAPAFHFVREKGKDMLLVKFRKVVHREIPLEGLPEKREFVATFADGRARFEVDGKEVLNVPAKELMKHFPSNGYFTMSAYPTIEVSTNTGISGYRCRVLPSKE